MRYGIISDIHANLEAFRSVLDRLDGLGVESIVCLGDVVGYNANPNECLDLIKERNIRCVMGNHDLRAAGLELPTDFNYYAAEAIYWTRRQLTEENRNFLANLPKRLHVDGRFLAIHGWVNDTDRYIFGPHDALKNFRLLDEEGIRLCFFGHTHVAVAYLNKDDEVLMLMDEELKLEDDTRYLINPGGLGQPRDRDPRAPFVVYDTENSLVRFYRVEYDVEATGRKVVSAGLSVRLAERLKAGW